MDISQQRSHVKIEITYSLDDADQPTNQPARAVRDSSKPARRRRRPRPRPRRQQPTRPSPRATEPPTPHTVERPPPATIQRPASSTSTAEIPPSPITHHRQLPTVPPSPSTRRVVEPKRKIIRASTPKQLPQTPRPETLPPEVAAGRVGTSTSKKAEPVPELSPEPMETLPSASASNNQLNQAISEPTMPSPEESRTRDIVWQSDNDAKYDLAKVIRPEAEHPDEPQIVIIQGLKRGDPSKPPAYFLFFTHCKANRWFRFKGPTSKHHESKWWEYCDYLATTRVPLGKKASGNWKSYLRALKNDPNGQLI